MARPVVFISYSQDSDEHREKVLGLAERLRQDGLDARLDQYVNGTPNQGWPRWMLDQLEKAGFVLVVCTETYYRRLRGHEEPGRGKGADWEGALITQEIYDARSRTVKFVPVTLAAGQERFIPEPLRLHTHYELTSEERYQTLYRFLRGQAGVKPQRLGKTKPVSKRTAQPLTFGPTPVPSSVRPTMIGVPHRNPFFTGREMLLSRLHQQLQTQGISALAQAAIHGLGGIGKTQTAIEYAHRFGEHYRFVLWVVAEEEEAIRLAYRSIVRGLGLVKAQTDLETAALAVKAWLSREDGWLLVFDSADDLSLVRAYLPPTRAGGKVLLTSRAKSFVNVGIRNPFQVEILEIEDAVKFLIERTGNADAETAAALAAELGYLPLALEQAAAYIEVVGGGFAEYLARYRRQGLALLARGKPSTDYTKTVATTWSLSFDAVREASPASADLLTAAAFLVPDSIPAEIFTRGASELSSLLAKELKGADEDPFTFWELLGPLERYSLIDRLPDNAFKLHRLTQEVVKDSLGDEGRPAWADRVVRALNAVYPEPEFDNWRLCERLQPHARLAYEVARTYKLASVETAQLFNQAGCFAGARGDHHGAKLFLEFSLEIKVHNLGGEHLDTLKSRNNLAATLRALGDLTGAATLFEQTLKIQERTLGGEHLDALTSRNNLGETLRGLGDLAGAKQLHEQNLKIFERMLGGEYSNTLTSRNNLANTLRASGDLAGAKQLHEQNLEIAERVLGGEHPNTLMSRSNLAQTLLDLGNFADARRLHEQTLEIRERVLGDEHPDTLQSRNYLAGTLADLGNLTGARKLLMEVLDIRERVLGDEHPDTLHSRNDLATTLADLGDFAGARKLHEQNLEIRERVLGSEHPETLRSRNNLAQILCSLGDLVGAKELQEQALEIHERVLGGEHHDTLTFRNNLARILLGFGDLARARKLQEQNLEIFERVLGREHPHTTASIWNLLWTVHQLEDSDAEALLIDKLRWLLKRDEDAIPSANVRKIRQWLLAFLNPS